ncbi:MAG: hypothetical protein PHQ52_01955 [Candidatus Omnitrophica bacterium]|nr:hypothetical protein [Candidatus Omnitrophota bacterium]
MKKIIILVFLISSILINTVIAKHKIFDGTSWLNIPAQFPSVKNTDHIKDIYIRASEGTAFLSGTPNILYNTHTKDNIILSINLIYENKNNTFLPLYYSLNIIGMQKKGVPTDQINLYISQIKRTFNL